MHLLGLSNGARGVSQLAANSERRWRSLILVSPVFDQLALSGPHFSVRNAGRAILVISGTHDDRVPPA